MAEKNMQVTLLIPTYNEIDGMKWFMPQLKKEWYDQLLIVDGGSCDGTVEYCRLNNYPFFIQSGKGLPNAYDEAMERVTGDIIVTVTPDGNSLAECIPKLTQKIREGCDMAIASRYAGSAISHDDDTLTALGNRMFTAMINFLFNAHYADTMVGYRAYRRDVVDKLALRYQDKNGWLKSRFSEMNSWEVSTSIRAAKLKLKVCEVPGDEPKRIGGKRKLSIIKNGTGTLLQVLHEFIIGKRFYRPNTKGKT